MPTTKRYEFTSKEPACNIIWMTPDWVREAMGLEEDPKKGSLRIGKKTYTARNNRNNRPIRPADRKRYCEEMLSGSWEFTGESISFDTSGDLISGQHRGLAVLDAEAAIASDPARYRGVKLEYPQVVAYGVKPKAADKTDTGVSRNATDVIYRRGVFKDLELKEAKKCSADLAVAQRLVWLRLRGKPVSKGGRQINHEMLQTLKQHPGLEVAVRFIYELDRAQFTVVSETDEEGNDVLVREEIKAAGSISNKISRGYAAALLYLAACVRESRDDFMLTGEVSSLLGEDGKLAIDVAGVLSSELKRKSVYERSGGHWYGSSDQSFDGVGIVTCGPDAWQQACSFWHCVSEPYGLEKGDPIMAWIGCREKMRNDNNTNRDEIVGVTIKAWNAWAEGDVVKTPSKLVLKRIGGIAEFPVMGGLDVGDVSDVVPPDVEEATEE